MKLPRRSFLHLTAAAAAVPAMSHIAAAETYPSRSITMVVPFAAGGPVDTLARIVAERMRTSLGQPVVIENVTGAVAASALVGLLAQSLMVTRLSLASGPRMS